VAKFFVAFRAGDEGEAKGETVYRCSIEADGIVAADKKAKALIPKVCKAVACGRGCIDEADLDPGDITPVVTPMKTWLALLKNWGAELHKEDVDD
jgi:hypothetical protein